MMLAMMMMMMMMVMMMMVMVMIETDDDVVPILITVAPIAILHLPHVSRSGDVVARIALKQLQQQK